MYDSTPDPWAQRVADADRALTAGRANPTKGVLLPVELVETAERAIRRYRAGDLLLEPEEQRALILITRAWRPAISWEEARQGLGTTCSPLFDHWPDADPWVRRMAASVLRVERSFQALGGDIRWTPIGSAALVSPDRALTAGHIAEVAEVAALRVWSEVGQWHAPVTGVRVSTRADVAVLAVRPPEGTPWFRRGRSGVTGPVLVLGYPGRPDAEDALLIGPMSGQAHQWRCSPGRLQSWHRTIGRHDATTTRGSSGSAACNPGDGTLVGVHVSFPGRVWNHVAGLAALDPLLDRERPCA